MSVKRRDLLKLAATPGTKVIYVFFMGDAYAALGRIPSDFRLPLEFLPRAPDTGLFPFRVDPSELNNN
jgi:hypothetical protein